MEDNQIEIVDNAHSANKHRAMLNRCDYYIQSLNSQAVSEKLFQEAYNFAMDAYSEVQKDDLIIAQANTSLIKRNVDAIIDLRINLESVHKMLVELLVKDAKDIARDLDDCLRDK